MQSLLSSPWLFWFCSSIAFERECQLPAIILQARKADVSVSVYCVPMFFLRISISRGQFPRSSRVARECFYSVSMGTFFGDEPRPTFEEASRELG